jgi:hypothetical protein
MLLSVFLLTFLFSPLLLCSSHSEAPSTAVAAGADITDLYMFRSYEAGRDAVTFIINSSPLQSPFAGPNYYGFSAGHFYQLHLSTDCTDNHVFSFYFGANLGGPTGNVDEYDFDGCAHNYNIVTITSQTGIEIDVLNADGSVNTSTPIPLKALGVYTTGDDQVGSQNYFEFFHVDYSTNGTGFPRQSLAADLDIPYPNVGDNTFPGDSYAAYLEENDQFVHTIGLGAFCTSQGRVFAGQRADSFSVNLGRIFDRLNFNPIPGFASSVVDDDANNQLRNKNVQTIALEIPLSCMEAIATGGVVGAWATVSELYHDIADNHLVGAQFSRLGNPLVNEVAIGLVDKQLYSISPPSGDLQFAPYVFFPSLPAIINAVYLPFVQAEIAPTLTNLAPVNLPRQDLVAIFLTGMPTVNQVGLCEMMRLNVSIPPVRDPLEQHNMGILGLDLAGYPNGRRPGDDVVDISMRAMMGVVCARCEEFGDALGADVCAALECTPDDAPIGGVELLDGAPQNAMQFTTTFPYLNQPHSGATGNVVRGNGGSSSSASEVEAALF